MKDLTPAMRQYLEIKENYKDCILFFRMGDFYEMFFEDAVAASKLLEITLTSRNKNKDGSIPLCGVPYHAASVYIAKLIEKGCKVAICEQLEDPKEAKGIVKRDVVRVITPGLVVDSETLDAKANNFLAGIFINAGRAGLTFIDVSTGELWVTESRDEEEFYSEIAGLDFREIIIENSTKDHVLLQSFLKESNHCVVNTFPADYFDYEKACSLVAEYFDGAAVDGINLERHPVMAGTIGAVLRYIEETQKDRVTHIKRIKWHSTRNYLVLDETAKRNLELFTTIHDKKKEGSLFHVLDQTVTSMGGRRLRWWINYPLLDPERIRERLAAVSEIKENHMLRDSLRTLLSGVYDMERLGSRIVMDMANGRDLIAMERSLQKIPAIKENLGHFKASLLVSICQGLDEMTDIASLISKSINEEPPVTVREGYVIKQGYDQELDELIALSTDGKQWIAGLELKERKRTGINSLKVGFNNVFGYYFEITKANTKPIPENYIRKQTLVNAERYINEELKQFETTVMSAEEKRKKREYELFVAIRKQVGCEIQRIQKTASLLADLDGLVSFAEVAERYGYCCPKVNNEDKIKIREGRHPVVERMDISGGFVPNDVYLDLESNRFLIITGPNMAGKSTYIRQTALIVLMAQAGSFVPAQDAVIGVADRIFTRVGAADSLAKGQSTFMVEMNEVSNILRNATSKSLIFLDEVGRGTSTFDGLSIAWAVVEYIHDKQTLGARSLFATHYHELTDLVRTRDGVKNYSVAVKEWEDDIIFLRKIIKGGANRSYGIQVARLAGVPAKVVARAKEVLYNLERGELDEIGMPKIGRGKKNVERKNDGQLSLFIDEKDRICHELKSIEIASITPVDALNKLHHWQKRIKEDE